MAFNFYHRSFLYATSSTTQMKGFFALLLLVLLFLFPSNIHAQGRVKKNFIFDSKPAQIIVPSVGISLPVYEAKVAFDTWEVRTDGASFGEGTSIPGRRGNTVIFSHAMPHLFGNLVDIKKGDKIHVFTDHDWFAYKVVKTLSVNPENVDVITPQNKHELTLYTCEGDDYAQRFIVKAELIRN